MIDKDQFATGMGLLGGAFGRDVDAAVSRAYYLVLNPKLSTEDFQRAVERTIEQETYWPSPAVLLGKVLPPVLDAGELALRHVNAVMGRNGGYQYLSHATFHAEFDAPTRAAISACGGLAEISRTSDERWPALTRKFAAAYARAKSPRPALPAPDVDPRVKRLASQVAETLP